MRAEVETSVNLFLACVYVECVLLFQFDVQFYHIKVLERNPIIRILKYITTPFRLLVITLSLGYYKI